MSDTSGFFDTQATRDVPRDRYGRYLLPDAGGKNIGWTRATTFAATLAESYGLRVWEQRQVVWGLSRRPDLLSLATTIVGPEDKKALGEIVEAAHEAGATKAKANRGTAIHAAIGAVEIGGRFEDVPAEFKPHVAAYFAEVVAKGLTILPEYIERTGICPDFGVAGTFDNLVLCPDGKVRVLDKKTGNLDYAEIEFAVQLALYAHFRALRNYATNQWEPMPEVATDYAIIAHIDPASGKTELERVNITLGWAWARTCAEVQDIRKTKHVITPYIPDTFPAKMMIVGEPTPPPFIPPRPAYPGPDPFGASNQVTPAPGVPAAVPSVATPTDLAAVGVAVTDAFWDQADEDDDLPAALPPFIPTAPVAAAAIASAPQLAASSPTTAAPAQAGPTAVVPVPLPPSEGAAGSGAGGAQQTQPAAAAPAEDAEARAEALVKGAKGKAKLQQVARDIMSTAAQSGGPADSIKLNQHQIRLARDVVKLADQYGIPLPEFEKPRRAADGPTAAETAEDKALTDSLKYIRSMPTVQGLVEYQTNLGEGWTADHQEAARVRVEQLNQQAAAVGGTPLTPAEMIAGATSPQTLQMAWRSATGGGTNLAGWTAELESAAQAKSTELGVTREPANV